MEKYGPVFVWYLGPKAVVVLTDPEEWHALLSGSNTSPLPKWAKLYAVSESVSTWGKKGAASVSTWVLLLPTPAHHASLLSYAQSG